MKKILTIFFTLILTLTLVGTAAGGFQEELKKMAEENAKGYIGPFCTGFGTAMNSGLYHTAKAHSTLGFDLSFKFMWVTVPDKSLKYDFFIPDSMTIENLPASLGLPNNQMRVRTANIYPAERDVPTAFGDKDGTKLTPNPTNVENEIIASLRQADPNIDIDALKTSGVFSQLTNIVPEYTVKGIGFSYVPLFMPQLSVGLIKDTEFMFRFFPKMKVNKDIGEIGFLGIGIKHGIDQWIPVPMFPFNITAQYIWQKLEVGDDLLSTTNSAFNIHASKKLGIGVSVTPYLGLGFESSKISVKYEITGTGTNLDGTPVDFELDGDNNFRTTLGFRVGLPVVTINADYSIGEYNTISFGLGLSIR